MTTGYWWINAYFYLSLTSGKDHACDTCLSTVGQLHKTNNCEISSFELSIPTVTQMSSCWDEALTSSTGHKRLCEGKTVRRIRGWWFASATSWYGGRHHRENSGRRRYQLASASADKARHTVIWRIELIFPAASRIIAGNSSQNLDDDAD